MSNWKFCLHDDYTYFSHREFEKDVTFYDNKNTPRLRISSGGDITVLKGYAWDGCSPKFNIFDWGYIGVPDGTMEKFTGQPKAYFASLVHDALYQFINDSDMPYTRVEIDKIFFVLLQESKFSLRAIYYGAVRLLGGIYHCIKK